MEEFTIEEVDGFRVVRDDLYEGGTKRRAFARLVGDIQEKELVYAADYYGHAAYAIGLVAEETGKKVTLFYPMPRRNTDIFTKTTALSNVEFKTVDVPTQVEAAEVAKKYAGENKALFLQIGLDFPAYLNKLEEVVREAHLEDAPEIWCMGGSGALARSLQRAYPHIPVKVVSVGTSNANFDGVSASFDAPEHLDEEAEIRPPYPSSPNYDAKTWRFIQQHAKPGACIWNVA